MSAMEVGQIVLAVMAIGAVAGGVDLLFGNRLGLGERFEEAFRLLGPIGLGMAGILCLAPVLAKLLGWVVAPGMSTIGLDPGLLGGLLAVDMGGYPLAMELAEDPGIGKLAGILLSSTFGCTLVFTLPVGLRILKDEDRPLFIQGTLLGLGAMALVLLPGAMAMGIPPLRGFGQLLPVLLLCGLLGWAMVKRPRMAAKVLGRLASGIRILSVAGLTLGAAEYLTPWQLLPGMTPLEEAMEVVCSIGIVMLGSMPFAELLRRALTVPFRWIGARTGMNSQSYASLLVGMVSVTPALAAIPRMDPRGKVVVSAFLVCAGSCFAAHLGYTVGVQPELTGVLLGVKLLGGLLAILLALFATGKGKKHA